ncbi:MAG TPA: hypothetical protein VG604_00865, partial [Candidatus Saccharimonadales bacterium]|nr:hypothetical protein [Candidatus Saccharimonadales bacterium]
MTDLEIPFEKDRRGHYRFFEILPGAISWTLLILPIALSLVTINLNGIQTNLAVIFVLLYLLIFFTRGLGYAMRAIAGYRDMRQQMKLDWHVLSADIDAGQLTDQATKRPHWHLKNLRLLGQRDPQFK